VSALTQDDVGQYLNRHFVSAFQKVGTFRIQNGNKQGGNVASYFCTPDGRVLHAIAGPVGGAAFLREARWANETYQLALMVPRSSAEMQAFFRKAHLDRLQAEHFVALAENRLGDPSAVTPALLTELLESNVRLGINNAGKVHLLLAAGAMPRLDKVYQVVFESILNEKISTQPVKVAGR
jgi:hypothetical protein